MLNVIMLNVIMLNAILLNVVAAIKPGVKLAVASIPFHQVSRRPEGKKHFFKLAVPHSGKLIHLKFCLHVRF
jgi:hypothetical protein